MSNGCGANALVSNYNFIQASGSLSSLYTLEMPDNKIVTSSYYQKAGKYFKLLSLKCKYRYQYPGIVSREQMVDLTSLQKFMESGAMDYLGTATAALDVVLLCLHATPAAIFAVVLDVLNIVVGITTCTNHGTAQPAIIYTNGDMNAGNALPSGVQESGSCEWRWFGR